MATEAINNAPWRYDSESSTIQCRGTWYDDEGEYFDYRYPRVLAHVVEDWDERQHGYLFAAAPAMLTALQKAALFLESDPNRANDGWLCDTLREVNAAIAAATRQESSL